MLIAAGPDVTSAQDYTERIAAQSIQIVQNQGDTLDTMKCIVNDPFSQFGIGVEDEIYVLEENDPNGWPTTNLLQNTSFSGTYGNGGTTAPSWGFSPFPSSGVSYNKSTSGGVSGGNAQQITIANMSATTPTFVSQAVILPVDEFGNPLNRYPYYWSLYINQTVTPVNLSVLLRIDWYNANGVNIGSSGTTIVPAANTGYARYWVNGAPLPGAVRGNFVLRFQGTTATNSGTFLIDNAQVEYATFYGYQSMGFNTPLMNPTMLGTIGGSFSTSWSAYQTTSTTTSVVSAPALSTTSQQITVTNAASNDTLHGIQQTNIRLYKLQNYTCTMQYWVTSAFSGALNVEMAIHLYDTSLNDLGSFSVFGPTDEGITNQWQSLSFRMGPSLANAINPAAVYYAIHAGILSSSSGNGTNSGAIVIGEFDIVPDNTTVQYAGLVGIYPTPYCDQNQTGCYLDTATNRPYRNWRYFGGFVKNAVYDHSISGDRYIEVDAVDFSILLQEAPATILILNVTDVEAINQACTYAHNQGFLQGLDWTTHVSSIGNVNAMLFNWRTTRDVLTEVSNQTIAVYYVDPYKFLWYQPALANSAPFALSDVPDPTGRTVGIPTYQMSGLKWNQDSTETVTAPVIEGSTQLSAPQTYTNNGNNTTTTSTLLGGQYNYITTTATSQGVVTNNTLLLYDNSHIAVLTVAANASTSATTINISAFKPTVTINSGANVGLVQTQTTADLTSGTPYTSIPVNALTVAIPNGSTLILYDGTDVLKVTTNAIANIGATTISIPSTTPSATINSGANVGVSIATTNIALSTTVTAYSSIPVAATPHAIPGGAEIVISDGTTTVDVTVANDINAGVTSIPISPSLTPPATILSGASVAVDGYVLNGNNPIAQIDSVTVGGVAQGPIGLTNTNSYAQGYTILVDLQSGTLYFQTAPASGSNNVVIIYRYAAPVIVRLTVPTIPGPTKPRRKIHSHQKEDHITSQRAAIDRANAELQINAKAKPIGDIILTSPPVPFTPGLHAGQAIQVWFAKANQVNNQLFAPGQLFQIQSNTISPKGNGVFQQTLKIGFYQPDFAIYMAQIQRDNMESTDNNNTILQDILTNQDISILSDSLTFHQLNTASWYGGSPPSNSFGWAPVVAPRQQGVWG